MSVRSYLRNLASDLYISRSGDEYDSIERSVDTIERRLKRYFESKMEEGIRFGSSTRGTMLPRAADPKSDVDYMVIFKNEDDYKPQSLVKRLKRFANTYYTQSEIRQSHPTVVLELNHIMFDLVPAYRDWFSGLQIPAPKSNFEEWTSTDPKGFNDKLVRANKNNDYELKPTVRLIKYWNAQNDYVYESFKLEKELASASYLFKNNKWDYFKAGMESLPTWRLPDYKKRKVKRAQRLIDKIKSALYSNNTSGAESKLQRLLPSF